MLHYGSPVGIFYVRESMRPAPVAYQKAVALGVVAGIVRTRKHLHKPAVAVLAVPG